MRTAMIDLSKIGKVKTFGSSMYPLLRSGDIVYYEKISFSEIEQNDILVIKKQDSYITHRVVYRTKSLVITKGDSNPSPDEPAESKDIIGKVYKIKRGHEMLELEHLYLIQSTVYYKEILRIQKVFTKAQIPFVILKGLPLHLYYEGRHPKRVYADCDILIDKRYKAKADVILREEMYAKIAGHILENDRYDLPEVTYSKKAHGFVISFDIHYELFLLKQTEIAQGLLPHLYLRKFTKRLIAHPRTIHLHDDQFTVLSVGNLIVYLAFHYFHHNYRDMRRLKLLDSVIRQESKNGKENILLWSAIAKTVIEYRLESYLYPAFYFCKKYYDSPIPDRIILSWKPGWGIKRHIIQRVEKHLFEAENRIDAGIMRFFYAWVLSPVHLYKKVLIFFQMRTILLILWAIRKKISLKKLAS
jgi:signal peptidase I